MGYYVGTSLEIFNDPLNEIISSFSWTHGAIFLPVTSAEYSKLFSSYQCRQQKKYRLSNGDFSALLRLIITVKARLSNHCIGKVSKYDFFLWKFLPIFFKVFGTSEDLIFSKSRELLSDLLLQRFC